MTATHETLHWCFADLLAVLCQLSIQVPALRQVI